MKLDKKNRAQKKQEFIWNMVGSIANTSTTVVLLMAVTHTCGVYDAGIFSIAYATAQIMMIIGNFGVRAFQATDIVPKYNLTQYFSHRVITCSIMMLVSVLYCIITSAQEEKFFVIFFMCLLKMIEAFSDVFEGYMQQIGHLDIAGKTVFIRTILFSIGFIIVLYFTKNLVFASVVAVLISVMIFVMYNVIPVYLCEKFQLIINRNSFTELTKECFSLFVSMFLMMFIVNAPKYAIDTYMSVEYQTYYNVLYTPAQIINLLSAFMFKPLLTELADLWNQSMKKRIKKYLIRFYTWIFMITLCAIGVANLIGIPFLSLIYGINLSLYKKMLLIILVGGGLNAVVNMQYYILTAMRKQRSIFIGYVLTTLCAIILPNLFVKKWNLIGAVYSYIILMGVLMIGMFVCILLCIQSKKDISEAT